MRMDASRSERLPDIRPKPIRVERASLRRGRRTISICQSWTSGSMTIASSWTGSPCSINGIRRAGSRDASISAPSERSATRSAAPLRFSSATKTRGAGQSWPTRIDREAISELFRFDQALLNEPSLARTFGVSTIGPIDQTRALEVTRRYLRAFFDTHLKSMPDALLDGPNADFPEVLFK